MDDGEKELKEGFLEEAEQLLADTEHCFLDLETASDPAATLERIFRLAHNIKGSAAAVGFEGLSHFTHEAENFLHKLKDGTFSVDPRTIDLLLKINDELRKTVGSLKEDLAAEPDHTRVIQEIRDFQQNPGPEDADAPDREDPAAPGGACEPEPADDHPWAPQIGKNTSQPSEEKGGGESQTHSSRDETLRVGLARIDRLMNSVGELVILESVVAQHKDEIPSAHLRNTLSQMQKIIRHVQEVSMGLRMVPLKQTFRKMGRIVRDTSKSLGKSVSLEVCGEDTELDKTVIESIQDPLTHLVRNSVDHGIEDAAERTAAGKPLEGTVHLSAYHKGGNIVIEVGDDGGGLNAERLQEKARQKGLLRPDQNLDPDEAHELVFSPGFSTKDEATDISGRGVGMDVVRSNVRDLRGDVKVESQPGQGTRFKVMLPLTLAVIDGLIVHIGEERYIVPIAQVSESVHPAAEDLNSVQGSDRILMLRGDPISLVYLEGLVKKGRPREIPKGHGIAMIVAGENDTRTAVLVDDISDQQQVVIKRLGSEIDGLPGVSGAAILGDGKPAPILDLQELLSLNHRSKKAA